MADVWDQAAASLKGQAPTAATPQPAKPAGDVWDQASKSLSAPTATPGHAPGVMDDIRDSANFLKGEVSGFVDPHNISDALHGAWNMVSMGLGMNPQGLMDSVKKTSGELQSAQKSPDMAGKVAHGLGAIPGSPTGEFYDLYQNGKMDDLAKGIGKTAFQVAAGKLATGPEGKTLAGKVAELPEAIGEKASQIKDGLPIIGKKDPHDLIMQGVRPASNPVGFRSNLSRSMPDLKAAEVKLGKPIESVDDLIGNPEEGRRGAIQIAKESNRQQYKSMFPNGGLGVDLAPVADAMEASITKKMRLENPAKAKEIQATADKYRKTFPIEDVSHFLIDANGELDSYYGKNPAARRGAAAMNPDTAATVAQASGLRKALYKTLDSKGQDNAAAELQKRYGALIEMEEAAYNRKNVAERQAPENLSQQLSKIGAAMKIVHGAGKAIMGNPAGALDVAEGIAGSKTANYLRELNSTNGLIKRAFSSYDKAPTPIIMPPPFRPKALLGPASHQMPGIADPSGAIPGGPYMGRGMSPSIGNRMLPAPSRVQSQGFATGTTNDLVPVKHPVTGKIEYVPAWMLQDLKIDPGKP